MRRDRLRLLNCTHVLEIGGDAGGAKIWQLKQIGKAMAHDVFARLIARHTVVGSTLKMVAILVGVSFSAAICSCA